MEIQPHLVAAQHLDQSNPVHSTRELAAIVGSIPTAQRYLRQLENLGFATNLGRGHFTLRSSLFQPYSLWPFLLPSLQSSKKARYFGKSYNESDVHLVRRNFPGEMVTLDYRAYELTGLQTPEKLFLYVGDQDAAAKELEDEEFSEGTKGRIVILPRIGNFDNEIQRVYLDCLAAGGRSLLDAVAIEILYPDRLQQARGLFPVDLVEKVRDDLSSTVIPVMPH